MTTIRELRNMSIKHNSRLKKDFSKCDCCGWKKKIGQIIATIIILFVGMWILAGSKVKYGKMIKTSYGYKQKFWLEVWGKRI